MRIYTNCSCCDNKLSQWIWYSDRITLKMHMGDSIEIYCKRCNKSNSYSVNDFYAKESRIALIIAFSLLLVGTPFLFVTGYKFAIQFAQNFGIRLIFVAVIPSFLYEVIRRNEKRRVELFNKS